ncbi:hypothetical protein IMZ48_07060 [Candidatus Bathyarchaeota archaeon]|nr:hypothetical protein [Candidatus Bathyarchaeota archaeon]
MTPPPRRSSLGMLLRRSKSGDLGKGRKNKDGANQPSVSKAPPKLPDVYRGNEQLSNSFGSEMRPDSVSIVGGRGGDHYGGRGSMDAGHNSNSIPRMPPPPVPNSSGSFDPYARTESMTHRGRYSYASSAISTINSPRKVRRRKDPTPFK